ncbi:MAG TPA: tripartite tricarboxylate transporter substrate binding protein [Pseudolabrys sp.]|nr:tripartite tricarboxylate transporter substrate binding protein [Pseudolabrys sp.]
MKILRRQFLHLAAGAATLPVFARGAWAEAYPARPVRMVVGFPAGQAADSLARIVAQSLAERLGQSFLIDNRPGAGGNIGTETVVKAPADGYTILMEVVTANTINVSLYPDLSFNFVRDIAPVALIGGGAYVMAVNPSVPAKTIPEFIAYAKANPGKINMGSAGIGTPPHAFGELFKMMAGVDMVHVPYKGSYVPDLLSGQVQVVFSPIPTTVAQIRAGQLRALGVTTAKRSNALPDVPSIGEFVSGYDATGYFGIGAPKNTPADVVDKLNKTITAGVTDPAVKAKLVNLGVEPMPMTAAEFGKLIAEETEKWAKVVKAAHMKAE